MVAKVPSSSHVYCGDQPKLVLVSPDCTGQHAAMAFVSLPRPVFWEACPEACSVLEFPLQSSNPTPLSGWPGLVHKGGLACGLSRGGELGQRLALLTQRLSPMNDCGQSHLWTYGKHRPRPRSSPRLTPGSQDDRWGWAGLGLAPEWVSHTPPSQASFSHP